MQGILDWLTALPPGPLYVAMACIAAVENVFPPIPADTIVAFGSFLAARGRATLPSVLSATLLGNLAGAIVMYGAGRRFGAEQVELRLLGQKGLAAEAKLRALYGRYGLAAIFLSRFLPGIRAIVPPFAGALRMPPMRTFAALALASGIWYGMIGYIAYRLGGADWEIVMEHVKDYAVWAAVIAGILAVAVLLAWLRRRGAGEGETT